MKFKLQPKYDNRQSFYGKAIVQKDGNRYVLFSYGIPVAEVNDGHPTIYGVWSMTTKRHQKEFLKQFSGMSDEEFKSLINIYKNR